MNARQIQAARQIEIALAQLFGGQSPADYAAAQEILYKLDAEAKRQAIFAVMNDCNPHAIAEDMVELVHGAPDWHRTDYYI